MNICNTWVEPEAERDRAGSEIGTSINCHTDDGWINGLVKAAHRTNYNSCMTRRSILLSTALFTASPAAVLPAIAQDSAVMTDSVPDKVNPAAMQSFQLPSHGALLNAFVYVAAGAGPHPTVVLLHGFPGNERNLDLAQSIRRAGWNVMYFDYRGSWGSPGDFSFTHCIEDTQSAIAYLRDDGKVAKLRSDPKTLVLIGHSMGGFVALQAGALDPAIKAIVTISAADLGTSRFQAVPAGNSDLFTKGLAAGLAAEGMAPLAGTTPELLSSEVLANATKWNFVNLAPKFATRPLLVITSDDGLTAPNEAFVEAVKKSGNLKVYAIHIPTDHSYSDYRIALQQTVLDELARLTQK
jgi:pimeloyl-ACP methyl ester carboxylesterase